VSRAFVILPDAQREITEAADWYHARNPRPGVAFRRELAPRWRPSGGTRYDLRPCTGTLAPRSCPGIRTAFTYVADDAEIVVVACTHHRRDPQIWMERVG
jgi:plasmid stabilization system protein ParE